MVEIKETISPVEISLSPEAEGSLIQRAQEGDVNSFEELISQHQKKVYNLALRLTNNRIYAQDITQDALVKVFKSLKNFRRDSSFSSWLYRIVHNVFLDDLKKSQRKYDAKHESLSDTEPGDNNVVKDISEEQILKHVLEQALAKLPLKLRVSLLMYEMQGFSYEEISEIEGATLAAIKSRILKARKQLSSDPSLVSFWHGEGKK